MVVVDGSTVCCSVGVSSTVVGGEVSGADCSVVVTVVGAAVVVVVVVVVTVVDVDDTVVADVSGFGGIVDINTQPSVGHFSGNIKIYFNKNC